MSYRATRLSRIRRIALAVRCAAIAGIACLIGLTGYSLMRGTFSWTIENSSEVIIRAAPSAQSVTDPQLALWLEAVQLVVLIYGLVRLAQMMRACEMGKMFSLPVASHLQAFSASILIVQVLDITLALQIAALRAILGRGPSPIDLTVSSSQLSLLMLATLFIVLAQILKEAARLAEDNASIV